METDPTTTTTDMMMVAGPTAALILAALSVLALRYRAWLWVLLAVLGQVVIAIAQIWPFVDEAAGQQGSIIWQLMIAALLGAVLLMIQLGAIFLGLVIGAVMALIDLLLSRNGRKRALWFTIPITIVVCLALGLAAFSPSSATTSKRPVEQGASPP
ncbi:hypothetical protein V8J82_10335 [Gymnodinialimonas sp. 2305UL16-5]|uniref:hypothetical protein n=1 Tax=Gymnodinialimonas mytili TaxID=3126503 RepID=UPI0030B713F3